MDGEDWVGVISTSNRMEISHLTTSISEEALLDTSKVVNNEIILIIQAELCSHHATILNNQHKHQAER